jgi:hypothetical protein
MPARCQSGASRLPLAQGYRLPPPHRGRPAPPRQQLYSEWGVVTTAFPSHRPPTGSRTSPGPVVPAVTDILSMPGVPVADAHIGARPSPQTIKIAQSAQSSRSTEGGTAMTRRIVFVLLCVAVLATVFSGDAQAQQAFGRQWGRTYSTQDWNRMYHYPYVYYPQNFWTEDYYRSSEDLYFRYPPEMRIPVYNKAWQNYYPDGRRYHDGHHFNLDVF